jgi:hypothetical protein
MCEVLLPPGVNPTAVKYIIYVYFFLTTVERTVLLYPALEIMMVVSSANNFEPATLLRIIGKSFLYITGILNHVSGSLRTPFLPVDGSEHYKANLSI